MIPTAAPVAQPSSLLPNLTPEGPHLELAELLPHDRDLLLQLGQRARHLPLRRRPPRPPSPFGLSPLRDGVLLPAAQALHSPVRARRAGLALEMASCEGRFGVVVETGGDSPGVQGPASEHAIQAAVHR
jgi:hypothetical protein